MATQRPQRPSPVERWVQFCRVARHHFLLLFLGLAAIGAGAGYYLEQRIRSTQCIAGLLQLYEALELYETDRGTLPNLTFYPDDPKQDSDSLVVALNPYVADPNLFLCPATARACRETGLTYIWNTRLNGKKAREFVTPQWMLVEINALSDQVEPPHIGRYHILYTDGTVKESTVPPPGLCDGS